MKLPPSAFLVATGDGAPRFQYRDVNGKVDLALLRKLPAEIAALPAGETRNRLAARVDSLIARAENPTRDAALRVEMKAASQGPVEIVMSGDIGEGFFTEGITANGVQRALGDAPGRPVRVRLNSRGGDAFEGAAIRSLLAASGRHVEVNVDGLAASAASVIAMAASPGALKIARNGVMMVHNASVRVHGGIEQLESATALLRAINDGAAEVYAARTGRSKEEIAQLMARETFMSATRAVELGFADSITPAVSGAAMVAQLAADDDELRAFLAADDRTVQDGHMDPKEIRKRLGLAENATDADVFAALEKAAKPAQSAPAPEQAVALTAADVARIATEAASAAVSQAATVASASQAHKDAVNAAVERFIKDGKIAPRDREKAVKACGNDAAQLTAQVEYWTACPRLVPEQSLPAGRPASAETVQLTPQQLRMAQAAGVKPATMQAVIAEGI